MGKMFAHRKKYWAVTNTLINHYNTVNGDETSSDDDADGYYWWW